VSEKQKTTRSLASIAGVVAVATLISKVVGLLRELLVAAAFGVGPVVNAYAYAYVVPGFLLILLGGINGPFHSALVSILAKRDKKDAAPLVETVTTLVSVFMLVATIVLIIFASFFIDILAPGLDSQSRAIAIQQLQIMAPLALLAGLIGIGFGTLNASNQYLLPSISPLFSSITVVIGVGVLLWTLGEKIDAPQYFQLGSVVLAGGTLAGGILQWVAQFIAQWRSGMGSLRIRFNWRIPGVQDVFKIMAPATLSSGMLHVNVYTDLFFASFIPNAAAAMRYANFIVLTPLGIISNMILVPFLPVFSRLTAPENWEELKLRIRQGIMLSALTMLPFTAIFMSLGMPIIKLIYERSAFKSDASAIVAPVLIAYGFGMFFYLGRDVLVRVFYALGDGETPFKISIVNIFLNGLLDYLFVTPFKTPGLILATVIVNITSMLAFLWILHIRLNGLPLLEWSLSILGLFGATFLSAAAGWGVSWGWGKIIVNDNILFQIVHLSLASLVAFVVFGLVAMCLQIPEVDMLIAKIKQKLVK
jgi:putative peptidoglycan lipid II flippase